MLDSLAVIPASGKHAIEVMAFAIELDRSFEAPVLKAIESCYDHDAQMKDQLPLKETLANIAITVNPRKQSVQMGNDGLRFSKKEGQKATWIVDVRQNVLSVNCFDYTRWQGARNTAAAIITSFLRVTQDQGLSMIAVGLQYKDVFRVSTTNVNQAAQRLFKDGNDWLTHNAMRQETAWHVHQGWFSEATLGRQVLNLLNVDAVIENDIGCAFNIIGQHRLLGKMTSGSVQDPLILEDVVPGWDELHQANKTMLHGLLSDAVAKQIGL